jgi:hypothetical protein
MTGDLCCVFKEDYLVIFIDKELANIWGMEHFWCLRSVTRRTFQIREQFQENMENAPTFKRGFSPFPEHS